MRRRLHLQGLLVGLLAPALQGAAAAAAGVAPPLMLAKVYRGGVDLGDYWASEKYDGVRGYWDGEKLLTRGGEPIAAPAWFTAGWPKVALDGELWAGRGQFAKAVSTVRTHMPDEAAWRAMRFMVFDLPAQEGPFTQRLSVLVAQVQRMAQPWVQAVAQTQVSREQDLQKLLASTVRDGGEGLMLHRGASLYVGRRSDDLLKLKTHDDGEAQVVAHVPGKGKYAGRLGALLVEVPATPDRPAQRFKLGTGFTDAQRLSPPAVGTWVTYRFRGLNDSGVPRFASYLREAL